MIFIININSAALYDYLLKGAFKIVGGWWGHQPRQPAVVAPHRPQHFKASDNFKCTWFSKNPS